MSRFVSLLIAAVLLICVFTSQTRAQKTPIPKDQYFGSLVVGNRANPQRLHFAFDFACGECVGWYLEHGQGIFDWLQNSTEVFGTVSLFPLPYHIASFDLAMASYLVRSRKSQGESLAFYRKVLSAKGAISNDKVAPFNRDQLREYIFKTFLADEGFYLDEYKKILADPVAIKAVRSEFKINAYNGVSGTPSFVVNGVKIDDVENFSATEWEKYFKSL